MATLVESLRIIDGKPRDLKYHEWRMQNARRELFKQEDSIRLDQRLKLPPQFRQGIVKCRILYNKTIQEIQFASYTRRNIHTLKLVCDNEIEYPFKYKNRAALNKLLKLKGECDDILIVKNGLITDSSFSNVAFFDGKHWYTPASPLLKGTRRQKLLDMGLLCCKDISPDDLKEFHIAALINCMMDFEDSIFVETKNIHA